VIRVCEAASNLIETHDLKRDFTNAAWKKPCQTLAIKQSEWQG